MSGSVELRRERQARYRARHPERVREQARRWWRENPDAAERATVKRHADLATYNATNRARYAANPFARYRRHLLKAHGLSVEAYTAMHEAQGGMCAICGQPETALNPRGETRPLAVDHDHETGAIRGLLCNKCNISLGGFGDSLERLRAAVRYLDR